MTSRLLLKYRATLALAAWAVASVGACTFPTVDYADSDASPTGGCSAPPACAADATKCGDDARKAFDACSHGCMNKPGCQAACDSDLSVALGQCNAICESCASSAGCTNATASCKGLVGG